MAEYDLGTAKGKIVIDSSGVGSGIADANRQIGSFNDNQRQTAQTLQQTGRGLLAVGGIAVGAMGLAINSAAGFESQLSGIQAVSQGTEEQMEAVRKKALQLGADTKFSAGEAAGAIEELSRRGIALNDIMGGAADATVALAAATGTDLTTAATIAANAMNVFGLQADDLGGVVNQIAGFDVVGSSVEDFGMALTQSGAVANLVGMSFEDLTLGLAAMSKAGINSSDAGTSMKTFLNNLQPTTEKQIALAQELGILTEDGANAFYDEAGSLKSLTDVAGVLNGAVAGLTDQQKQLALETLFGSDAIRAAAVIAEQGAPGFTALGEQIGSVDAEEQAATRMDNLSGSIEQLKGSVETYLISAGTPFLDSIRGIVDGITKMVNWFGKLPGPIQGLISKFVLFGGIALVLAGGTTFLLGTFLKFTATLGQFGKLLGFGTKATKGLTGATKLMNLAFLANPIFLIVAALVALAVGLFIAYKKSEKFRKFVDNLWQSIQKLWDNLLEFMKALPEKISGFFKSLGKKISGAFGAVTKAISGFFQKLPGLLAGWLSTAFKEVVAFLVKLPERTAFFLGLMIGKWIKFHIDLVKKIVEIGMAVVQAVIGFMIGLPGKIWEFLQLALSKVVEWGLLLVAKAIEIGMTFVTGLISFISTLPGKVLGIITSIITSFPGHAASFLSGALNMGQQFVAGLVSGIGDLIGLVKGMITGAINAAGDLASDAYNKLKEVGQSMWNGFKEGLGISSPSFIEEAMFTLTGNVKKSLSTLGSQVKDVQWLGGQLPSVAAEFSSVGTLGLATTPALAAVAAPVSGEGSSMTVQGPLIGVAHIRKDQDIVDLARALEDERALRDRSRGRKAS